MASFDQTTGSGAASGGSFRTLTAFFDSRTDAEEAVNELRAIGLPEASVRLTGNDSTASSTASASYSGSEHKGFWDSLADFFFPDDDRATYAEGLRRGGYLVTVSNIPENLYDRALDILDDEGSVDVDSRAEQWRSEGWTGASTYGSSTSSYGSSGSTAGTGGTMGMGTDVASGSNASGGIGMAAAGAGLTGSRSADLMDDADATSSSYDADIASARDDRFVGRESGYAGSSGSTFAGSTDASLRGDRDTDVIPVVEENLRIGKRDVNLGRVRVRSYVVEQPVQEQVNLREERVTIERRPVDRALTGAEDAFTDRVIEAEEHAEEAVVAKEARVREEIAVRKEAEEHTETVSDSVRRTEVEVEDDRTANRLSSDVRVNEDRNR